MADSTAPVVGGAIPLAPATVGGRRHKLKLVTKKKARKLLKKMGLKMRGGEAAAMPENAPVAVPEAVAKMGGADEMAAAPEVEAPAAAPAAGRRRKTKRGGKKSRRSIFGY
jgi:hypothetical protein